MSEGEDIIGVRLPPRRHIPPLRSKVQVEFLREVVPFDLFADPDFVKKFIDKFKLRAELAYRLRGSRRIVRRTILLEELRKSNPQIRDVPWDTIAGIEFKRGYMVVRSDTGLRQISIDRIYIDKDTITVEVERATTAEAELVMNEVIDYLEQESGFRFSQEDQVRSFETTTKERLVPLNRFLREELLRFLTSDAGKDLIKGMIPIFKPENPFSQGNVVIHLHQMDFTIFFTTTSGARFTAKLEFSHESPQEWALGIIKVTSELPSEQHHEFVARLKELLKDEL